MFYHGFVDMVEMEKSQKFTSLNEAWLWPNKLWS